MTNESQWPVEIQLNQVLERAGSVCCQPGKLVLQPLEQTWFTAVICLKAHGMVGPKTNYSLHEHGLNYLNLVALYGIADR